ncbi:MAG: ribonuclease R family protein, partial [Terriglobales bacterium]
MAHIEELPHRRATLKQLLRELQIKGGERAALRSMLAELVHARRLIATRHAYELPPVAVATASRRPPAPPAARPAASAAPLTTGRISVHREGFAFVLPGDAAAVKIQGDIFIPPPFVGGAMHGDTVAVRILKRSAPGRAEGQVVRIVRRAHATVVGELRYAPELAAWYLQPYDERLRERVIIPPAGLPPELASPGPEHHRVLGAETRRARAAATASLEGLVVDAAITQYPTAGSEAKGRVVEVLGRREDFGIDVEIIIRKYHLPHRFPAEVLAEAEAAPGTITAAETAARRDFRGLPIVTIDGETARDFDDAVYVRRLSAGGFELQVHIADVAHYVRPGTATDREARLRGTSVYFPDRAVPMLPIQLSTDWCSLRPQSDRLVMSCLMRFDPAGRLQAYEIAPGVIRSAARMTYTGVNAILTGAAGAAGTAGADFSVMLELERVLNQRRRERGSIDFDLPEPEIAFDEFGLMRSIVKSERNVAHRIIEEFMLAANETVAGHLERLGVPAIYRIHEKPDPRKVAEFEEFAA